MNDRFLVIDTETGGLDPAHHSILSLGAVVWERYELVDSFEILIREPLIHAEPEALKINGIELEKVHLEGIDPKVATDHFERFIATHFEVGVNGEKIPLIGHNLAFDVAFLKRLYRLAGKGYNSKFSHGGIDTAIVARFLSTANVLPLKSATSDALFSYFDISPELNRRHTALGDAIATAQLFTELLKMARGEYAK